VGELRNSDFVMNQVFWLGVHPGLNEAMLDYTAGSVKGFVRK
jgi:CDP-6-deoxy-D-xylo-4-hexulose-3-dehydrase